MSIISIPRCAVVVGGGGALGQEISQQLKAEGIATISLERSSLEASLDISELKVVIEKLNPSAIVNCIAITGLDKCFLDPIRAFEVNGIFAIKLACISKILKVPVLQFSTDNVFSCDVKGVLYRETDDPKPATVYGMSKLLGEACKIRTNAPFYVVRLPLLFGPSNRNQIIHRFVKQIIKGIDIRVSSDVFSTPVYTPDVADFTVKWVKGKIQIGSVTHLTSGQLTTLHDLVVSISDKIACNGKGMVLAASSSEFSSVEAKPLHGGLASELIPTIDLESAITRYGEWIESNLKEIINE